MKRLALFLATASVLMLTLTSCVTSEDQENLENTIIAQDEKMLRKVERAELRQESRAQKWENYSRRQDDKYDAWIDRAFN